MKRNTCFATSCVRRRVGVRERCSLYVDLAVFFRVSMAFPRAVAERARESLRGKDGRRSALWAGVIHSLQ